jgi:hypothetical protein
VNTAARLLLLTLLAWSAPLTALARTKAPVQYRFGTDLDWVRWRVAPRLSIVGAQRLLATTTPDGPRRTLDGYATLDVNIRRSLFTGLDAFLTVGNALDRRCRTIDARAYTHPEELIGAPLSPRRVSTGFALRIP